MEYKFASTECESSADIALTCQEPVVVYILFQGTSKLDRLGTRE